MGYAQCAGKPTGPRLPCMVRRALPGRKSSSTRLLRPGECSSPLAPRAPPSVPSPHVPQQIWERQTNGSWVLVHDSYVCNYCTEASDKWTSDISAARSGSMPAHSEHNHIRLTFSWARIYTWDGWDSPPACAHTPDVPCVATDAEIAYIQQAPNGWSAARLVLYIQNGALPRSFIEAPKSYAPRL